MKDYLKIMLIKKQDLSISTLCPINTKKHQRKEMSYHLGIRPSDLQFNACVLKGKSIKIKYKKLSVLKAHFHQPCPAPLGCVSITVSMVTRAFLWIWFCLLYPSKQCQNKGHKCNSKALHLITVSIQSNFH